jgi:hypothetical protein
MRVFQSLRRFFIAITMVLVLVTTSACSGAVAQQDRASYQPGTDRSIGYAELSRGNTLQGQNFGDWVVKTSKGLVQDAYVRDNNKLGVVISPQVRPKEVKPLAQSLVQGFRRSSQPDLDLTVLMYAPDKQLILTARYNAQTKQIEYKA